MRFPRDSGHFDLEGLNSASVRNVRRRGGRAPTLKLRLLFNSADETISTSGCDWLTYPQTADHYEHAHPKTHSGFSSGTVIWLLSSYVKMGQIGLSMMMKFLIALSSGLIVGMSQAAFAQSTAAPVGATGATSTTNSPLTPAIANPLLGATSSSQLPSFLVQSPPETIRIDTSAPSSLSLVIGPTNSNTAVLNGDVLTSSTPPASGIALNAFVTQSGLSAPPAPSAISPSFYPSPLAVPTSTANFLSQFQGGLTGIGITTGSTLPPAAGPTGTSSTPGATSTRSSIGTARSSSRSSGR
ncbi:hypothetical protein HYPP_03696 [Hyphomicrobium sp. ghe19]|nr:hypothetical protein HYPP_03696 [Hyphomicrobium sp. ghe19]